MHKINCVLIVIACFWILTVDCQGAGGGRGSGSSGGGSSGGGSSGGGYSGGGYSGGGYSGGGYSGGGYSSDEDTGYSNTSTNRPSCTTEECEQISVRMLVIFLGGSILIYFIVFLLCKCFKSDGGCTNNTPSSTNYTTSVRPKLRRDPEACKQQETPMLHMNGDHRNIFRDGTWQSRYCQYGKWHGPFEFTLSFDHQTMQVKGWGWDDVGKFTISGSYSKINFQMGLTKTYVKNTGDADENLGHSVTIQLTGNTRSGIFEGRWYVQTSDYQGDDEFELKFDRECAYYEEV